jgi:hypothetical protein
MIISNYPSKMGGAVYMPLKLRVENGDIFGEDYFTIKIMHLDPIIAPISWV